LPRRLQIEFSRIVQRHTDTYGGEMSAERIWEIFADEYLPATSDNGLTPWGRFQLEGTQVSSAGDGSSDILTATIVDDGQEHTVQSSGNGPIAAFTEALSQFGVEVAVLDYAEHALSEGGDATAAADVECEVGGEVIWGVGTDPSITSASCRAITAAVGRAVRGGRSRLRRRTSTTGGYEGPPPTIRGCSRGGRTLTTARHH